MNFKIVVVLIAVCFSCSIATQTLPLQAETNHSTISFKISIAGFSKVIGSFNEYSILLDWDEANHTIERLSSEIQVTSIDTGILARDEHLISSDFFDAETFPTIHFTASSIQKTDTSSFVAKGTFTMHGISQEIELPLTLVKKDGNTLGFQAMTTINRLDYGIGNDFKHTSIPDFLANEIDVEIYFWTKKRKE